MSDRTVAIYCFIDDLLKAMQHREDVRYEFSDSEIVTTAIVAMLFFGGNFERARRFWHSSGMMPRMLSRSRLSRRLSRLSDLQSKTKGENAGENGEPSVVQGFAAFIDTFHRAVIL